MRKIISAIGMFLISLFLLVPAVSLLVMSVKGYSPIRGLAGSPFVGLDNITGVMSNPNIGRVLGNTLLISLLSLIVGAGYLLAAFLSIKTVKNFVGKLVFTFLFTLPAIIPVNSYTIMLIKLLPMEVLTNSSILLQLIAAAETGLRFSAVFVIAALFSKDDSVHEALRYVLLYVAVRLILILNVDTAFLNGFSNPLTYEHLDTYGTYSYRTGLMQAQFSLYAGGYVVGLLLQLLPAIVGGILLVMLFKGKMYVCNGSSNSSDAGIHPIVATAVLPVVLLFLVIIAGRGSTLGLETISIVMSYANGIMVAAGSAIAVVALGMLLANAALGLKTVGVCLVAILYFISDRLLGPYFMIRELGMFNTIPGMILQNLFCIAPVALIGAMILRQNYSMQKVFAVSLAAVGMAFAWFWGDCTSAKVIVGSADNYPISFVMQQIVSGAASEQSQLSAILYILVPVLVAGVSIAAGGFIYQSKSGNE